MEGWSGGRTIRASAHHGLKCLAGDFLFLSYPKKKEKKKSDETFDASIGSI